MLQKGLIPSTKVLGLEVIADTSLINEKLDLPFDAKLLFLTRLRFANNDPIVFLETYIPYSKFPELLDQDYVNNSLYSLMEAKSNIRVDRVSRQIEAVNPTTREAKILQMEKGKAICLVKTIAYTDKGVPVEYSIARYRGDKNKFSVELYR
ncbi:MAG TPA: UTRA domain-containing protein [Ruminiclostridium sp.]